MNAAGELVIKTELAGMSREDIEIKIAGQCLTLTGKRQDPDRMGAKAMVLEINYGQLESVVEVPREYDLARAQISFERGLLRMVARVGLPTPLPRSRGHDDSQSRLKVARLSANQH